MAKFEIVPLGELKTRLPAKLMPLVEEYILEDELPAHGRPRAWRACPWGDDPKDLPQGAEGSCGFAQPRIRFPFRGEEGSLSFHLEKPRGRKRGSAKTEGGKRRGRPRKTTS